MSPRRVKSNWHWGGTKGAGNVTADFLRVVQPHVCITYLK